jgi:hypothetical protein
VVVILAEVAVVMIAAEAAAEANGCWFVVLNKTLVRVTIVLAVSVLSVIPRDVSSQHKMHPLSLLPRQPIRQPVVNPMRFLQLLVPQGSLVRPSLQHNHFNN